jgi:PAS domain S-box-containing protein
MEDLLKELERLPKNSLVLEIGFITDKSYRTFGVTETTKLFNEHSPVPIYSTYEQRLGFGIVGGKLLSARIHGTNAARIALRVLAGEKASAIPVVFESDSQFMFDYKVMKRFNIPLSSLPEGSTVINKPVSFYTAHRVVILTALGIIGILIVVISLLTIIIVQRRRSVVALRASEAKYYDLYENAPDMYFSVDMKTATITECNNMFVEAFGNSKEEILGLSIFEIPHPDGRGEVKRVFQQFAATGEVHDAERMIRRKDGEIIHVSLNASAVRDKEGRITHSRSVWRDITERKRAEHELSESEKHYRMLFNAIDEGFCIIEVIFDENEKPIDYRFLEINPSFEKQTGLIGAQGKRMRELVPEHEEHWFEIYGTIAVTGQPARFVNRAEQLHRWYDVYAFRLGQPENRQVAVLFNDITDSRRAEEELRDSREQLRALAGRLQAVREEERTQIAREIHDELGGALTGMRIDFSHLTRTALIIEDEAVKKSLLDEMDSLIKFIDATIHIVRRIAMELRPGVLDDLGLVAALEWQLKDFEKRTGIRCDFFPPGDDINLNADLSTALFRIFQEALTNVARHSGAREVCVHLSADADSSTLEVEDNGKGIEKEQTLSSKSLGILGMRERAQMFGGCVTVTGTPGRGTIVTVKIPSVDKRKMDRDQEGDAG